MLEINKEATPSSYNHDSIYNDLIRNSQRCVTRLQSLCQEISRIEQVIDQQKFAVFMHFFSTFSEALYLLAKSNLYQEIEDFSLQVSQLLLVSKSFQRALKQQDQNMLHDLLTHELLDNLTQWKILLTQLHSKNC